MKTITFYSYKGGVGRTLSLSNIATRLSEFKKKVCIIDFDLEAPGIPIKFSKQLALSRISIDKGLVDYINYFQEYNSTPESLKDYVYDIYCNQRSRSPISIFPAGNSYSIKYWEKLSTISWTSLFYSKNSKGLELFLDLKSRIEKELSPDILLIDSRTGISEISGVPLSILADEVVILAANNDENMFGTQQIINSISNPKNSLTGVVPKMTFVLSRIPQSNSSKDKQREELLIQDTQRKLNNFLSEHKNIFQIENILVLHSDRDLELKESFKIGFKHDGKEQSIATDYLELFYRLTENILSDSEIEKYNRIREAEFIYNQSLSTNSQIEKSSLITKAIKLDSSNYYYYSGLANSLLEMHKYDEAIVQLNKAIEHNSVSASLFIQRGIAYKYNKLYDKSLEDLNTSITLNPKNVDGYGSRGLIYTEMKNYKLALKDYNKALELDPSNSINLNNRGYLFLKMGNISEALKDVYKSIELNPQLSFAYTTLAEINILNDNDLEFYKNFELALIFNFPDKGDILDEEIYENKILENRFIRLLKKYGKNELLSHLTRQK